MFDDTSLVVGADSMIGAALLASLRADGGQVYATTRRCPPLMDRIYLDLSSSPREWPSLPKVRTAYLCAARSTLRDCEEDPTGTRRVNVDHTISLARRLSEFGTFVVWMSSSQVFDGSFPLCPADSPLSPRSEYGQQKADAETCLLELGEGISVARLTKVIAGGVPLFTDWLEALRAGTPIHPFSDMVMAPISLGHCVDAIRLAASKRAYGVLQVSAIRDISYEGAAWSLCDRIGAPPSLVQPTTVTSACPDWDTPPPNTSLDSSRLQSLGLAAPDPMTAVDEVPVS